MSGYEKENDRLYTALWRKLRSRRPPGFDHAQMGKGVQVRLSRVRDEALG